MTFAITLEVLGFLVAFFSLLFGFFLAAFCRDRCYLRHSIFTQEASKLHLQHGRFETVRTTFNATEEQMSLIVGGCVLGRQAAEDLIKAARRCHEAVKPLPYTNEMGEPVLAGANRQTEYTRDFLLEGFNGLRLIVGRDFHDLLKYRYKMAAIGSGPRFHSDEVWAAECAHLDRERERLQKLVDQGKDQL